MLMSVALAQVQSVFISGMATAGYALQGAVDWTLALYLTLPLLIVAIAGWYSAQKIKPEKLQVALALILLVLGIYLVSGVFMTGMHLYLHYAYSVLYRYVLCVLCVDSFRTSNLRALGPY